MNELALVPRTLAAAKVSAGIGALDLLGVAIGVDGAGPVASALRLGSGVTKDATIAACTGAARKVAAELGFGHSGFGLDNLPAGASGSDACGGVALRVVGCRLVGRGEGEPRLKLDAIDLVAQALRPAPGVGCLRSDEGVVPIEFGSGTHHVHGLQLTKPGGKPRHLTFVKCSDSIKA
jgi:hypothetical protein